MTKDEGLAQVTKATKALTKAQDKAAQALLVRDRAILEAQRSGATYPELAVAAGVTRDRIRQVLATMRRDPMTEFAPTSTTD